VEGGEKTSNKKTVVTFALVAVLAFALGITFAPELQRHFDPKVNVYMEVVKGEGTGASATIFSGNLITDIGEYYVGNSSLGLQENSTSWAISLSNDGSSSAAWTELPGEVAANNFTRAVAANAGPWLNSGDWAMNFTYQQNLPSMSMKPSGRPVRISASKTQGTGPSLPCTLKRDTRTGVRN